MLIDTPEHATTAADNARKKRHLMTIKVQVLAQMKALGISKVLVNYQGRNNTTTMNEVVDSTGKPVPRFIGCLEIQEDSLYPSTRRPMSLQAACDYLCTQLVDIEHPRYSREDGGGGTLYLNSVSKSCVLSHFQRVVTEEHFDHAY